MSMHVAMTMAVGLLLAFFGVHSAAGDKDDAVKKDMKLLAGAWAMQSFENNGEPLPAVQAKSITLTIKDNRYVVDIGDRKIEMTFTIDPTKKPKTIEFTLTDGDQKAVTHGIYQVTADTFKVCRTLEAGKNRPTAFATKEGSGTALAVYKRKSK